MPWWPSCLRHMEARFPTERTPPLLRQGESRAAISHGGFYHTPGEVKTWPDPMHPILFRIPLPKFPLKAWWALAAVAAIALIYAALGMRKKDRATAGTAIIIAAGAGIAGYVFRETKYEA